MSKPFQKVTGLALQRLGDFNELIDLQGRVSYLDSGQLLLFHLDRLRELDLLHVQLCAPVSDPQTQLFPIHIKHLSISMGQFEIDFSAILHLLQILFSPTLCGTLRRGAQEACCRSPSCPRPVG